MPKLEIDPSREGGVDNGTATNEAQVIPPLSDFNSSHLDIVQWRMNNLLPLLHGPETDPSANGELMLNGSQHFLQVYGSGTEARPFLGSVEGTFQFVTNLTLYSQSENSGTVNVVQNDGSEAADTDPAVTQPVVSALADGANEVSTRRPSPDQNHLPVVADGVPFRRHSHAANGIPRDASLLSAPQSMQPHSALLPNMDLPQRSVNRPAVSHPDPPHGFQVHSDQHSLDSSAQIGQIAEENGNVFTEANEERRWEGGVFTLLPPARPSYVPLILPIPRRRHRSVEVLSC